MSQAVLTTSVASSRATIAVRLQTLAAPIIGMGATGVMVAGAGTPSYWGDEAASVMSAQRPLWSLWQELGHVDAVHGAYYLFLHFWVQLVGTSELATRLPSAVAAGVAVSGVVVLGRTLFGLRTGVIAGLLMLALPEATRVAIETRSYAFSMALAVWLTVLLVVLLRRAESSRAWWALYAAGLAAGIYLFLYLGLLIVVHAVAVVFLTDDRRSMLRRWALAVGAALVIAGPVIVAGVTQEHQIAFLARRDYASAYAVMVTQWFHSVALAVLAWSLIAIGAVTAVMRRNRLGGSHLGAAALVFGWVVIPTAVLLAGNAWLTPMYNFRYTGFCLPAVALAVAMGVTGIADLTRGRRLRTLTTATLIVFAATLAAPVYASQRGEFAKDGGSDLRQTAAAVAQIAIPGDAVVFDQTVKPSRRLRLALDLYPSSFVGLDDVALLTPSVNRSTIWDRVAPLDTLRGRLSAFQSVVAVEADRSSSTDLVDLARLGFDVVDEIHIHRTTVYRLEKGTS
jgi:mannosyltransferase